VGIRRLSRILCAVTGNVMDRRSGTPADNKANCGIRSSGKELHRPKQEFALCAVALVYLTVKFLDQRKFLAGSAARLSPETQRYCCSNMHSAILVGAVWFTSPALRERTGSIISEYDLYKQSNEATSVGLRLEFWRKSLQFFAEAPLFGHGTGSIRGLFLQEAVGQTGAAGEVISNPHNQTLNVAVQWGALGILVLYGMWLTHLLLFRGSDLGGSIGQLVVIQNVMSSLFNSHLFDFHEGWMYVLGVGGAGGITLKAKLASGGTCLSIRP
jgi:hypothetical protein